jgi:triacylglycerol lipase
MQPSKNPVLLIHGIDDTQAIFHQLTPYLEQRQWQVYAIDLHPNNGKVGLDLLAKQVDTYIAQTFAPDQTLDLVGFSMGGIVSRYYMQRLGGVERVQRFITVASPHQGTWTAYGRQNPGANQMQPKSAFLTDLEKDVETLQRVNFTSIWTPLDLMIFPAKSSELPVGQSQKIWVSHHANMIRHRKGLVAIANALSEPLRN